MFVKLGEESLRRLIIPIFVLLIARHSAAQDVSWLAEVHRPPSTPPAFELGTMQPLLKRNGGHPVVDLASWTERRRELNDAWQMFLGPSPQFPSNTSTTVLKEEHVGDIHRILIRYECEPDLFVEAFLLRPISTEKDIRRPGLVALHHTAAATIDEIAGVSGPDSRQIGLKLAKRGFVVICPRCFLWQDASSLPSAVETFRKRHPQSLGMRKMLFDAQRAVDILVAQPDVDSKRIGAVGHSLGAKETLYLAAFDDRIRAAVASEGGTALGSTNWDASWYLGPQIRDPSFVRNHHELLAMIAPRPFLILGGETGPGAADGDRSWPLIEAAIPVCKFYDVPPRLGLLNHHQGHSIPDEVFERMSEWLVTYLRSPE